MTQWLEYDFHGYAAVRVASDAPTAPMLDEMFAPFRAHELLRYDLTITGEYDELYQPADAETHYRYTETGLTINGMRVQVLRDDAGFRLNGRRELLVAALPLLDRILLSRGVAMVHAATVDYRGQGVCLAAWGGTGKTSTIAKFSKLSGVGFMGDDWAFLTNDGELLSYHKPMYIKPHHRDIYPHLFQTRHKPLVPNRLSRQLGSLATRVHPIITTYPRLANATRRWSPEHITVTPQQAFPHASFSDRAPLGLAMFVERYDGATTQLLERDAAWMSARIIGNYHAELPQHSRDVLVALGATGLAPIEQYFADKAAVVSRALGTTRAYLLRVPRAFSPDQASDIIVSQVEQVLGSVPVPSGARA